MHCGAALADASGFDAPDGRRMALTRPRLGLALCTGLADGAGAGWGRCRDRLSRKRIVFSATGGVTVADMCLCRLVVSGPIDEVRRFMRAAVEAPVQSATTASPGSRARRRTPITREPLSFQSLRPLPDEEAADDLYGTPSWEPEEVTRNRLKRIGAASARVEYAFLTKWGEPIALVEFVSRAWPRLEFLLGAVAPAIGEANCWYFHRGVGANRVLSETVHEEMYEEKCRKAGIDPEEADLDFDLEFDALLMDAVVGHWTPSRIRAERARRRRAGRRRARPQHIIAVSRGGPR